VGHAELVVLGDDDLACVGSARRAGGVAVDLEGAERLLEGVVGQQPADEGASMAWMEPMMPGRTPSTPASAHDGAISGGGGSGTWHR